MRLATAADRYTPDEIAGFYAAGQWRPDTLPQLVHAQARHRPDKVFVTDGVTSLTYAELDSGAAQLAVGLSRLGIGPGDRVSVQIPSWAEFTQIAVALARIGAITVPIMPIYRRDEVGYILADAEVRLAIVAETFRGFDYLQMYSALRAERPALQHIVTVRGVRDEPGVIPLESLFDDEADGSNAVETPVGPDDPLVIVYSSGTTARPKGCLHTINTFSCGARLLGEAFDYRETDVQFNPSPITHTTGFITGFLIPLLHGASVHLMEAWEPVAGLAAIAQFRCTVTVTATTFLQTLMDAYDPQRHDPSSMRLWVAAGSPIPAAFIERARRTLPDLKVLSLYGRTENVTTTTCRFDDDPVRSITSDGKTLPGNEVQIVDLAGEQVPRGEEGDIAYKGPMHMFAYLNKPEATAELFTRHGFSRSGDLGVMDADGYIRVTGRLKDIVIRGGMNISVRQIEDLLTAHPAVRAVAAVAMPDPRLGEKVCCYLVLADGVSSLTLSEVTEYLLGQGLPIQKVPERLELVDALPMTATGKIQKHVLRADVAAKVSAD